MSNTIRDLDTVILTREIQEYGLKPGARGVVVDRHGDDLQVEFMNALGRTVAVLPLATSDVDKLDAAAPAAAHALPTVDELLDDELEALQAELERIATDQAPPYPAQRTPLQGRLKTVRWLKSQCPMTPEEFEQLLRQLASGKVQVPGDPLQMAKRQSKEMLQRWMVLTSLSP